MADNSGKVVKDMVSSSMRDLIFSSDKDSFILFYKPDCQHCRDFMPTWDNLGEALKVKLDLIHCGLEIGFLQNEEIEVLKMNLRENEIPPEYKTEFFVKEYPSIFFKVYPQKVIN